jgi:hypothetical protein
LKHEVDSNLNVAIVVLKKSSINYKVPVDDDIIIAKSRPIRNITATTALENDQNSPWSDFISTLMKERKSRIDIYVDIKKVKDNKVVTAVEFVGTCVAYFH